MDATHGVNTPESPQRLIHNYLAKHSETYARLAELKRKGWQNPEGDKHFQTQRQRADEADSKMRRVFFDMMCRIGQEIQEHTGAIKLARPNASVLDLCAAPGGFIATALKYNPTATVCGVSLPIALGGHLLLTPKSELTSRVNIEFLDITMLGDEFGLDSGQHPHLGINSHRPFLGQSFDLIFCDGQVLRSHARFQDDRRQSVEATRLSCSQLTLALQRIKEGGTLIMLLHKVESWHTVRLLHAFFKFASVHLYKPERSHAARSSFYLIASEVRPSSLAAKTALATWKETWKQKTLALMEEVTEESVEKDSPATGQDVSKLLEDFGPKLVQLAEPIWAVQKGALSNVPWTR